MRLLRPTVRDLALGLVILALFAAAAVVASVGNRKKSLSLDSLTPLLASGRFDEVEEILRSYLDLHPQSAQANLVMAQSALARPEPKPSLALDHLRRVRPQNRNIQAVVRLNEGKAHSAMGRQDLAEIAWMDALRLDPLVPEAGWNLLGLYHTQGRRVDSHRLAMRLFVREPDPHDRAQLLLELLRQDAQPISADSLIETLEPQVKKHPEDAYSAIALGRAYFKNGRPDDGLSLLQGVISRSPEHLAAWDALLAGLDEASHTDELGQSLGRLPARLAADARFARHRGALALKRQEWEDASSGYLRAWAFDRSDGPVLYRLCQALRAADKASQLEQFNTNFQLLSKTREQALPLYEEANAVPTLGTEPHTELCHRLADLRERMGRPDEALGWHRIVVKNDPQDTTSQAAVVRLSSILEKNP